jgi:hypothetical protein
MNSINNTLNGLASSLLLNVGLTSIAEKLDPMHSLNGKSSGEVVAAESCENCIWVCNFTPEVGQ